MDKSNITEETLSSALVVNLPQVTIPNNCQCDDQGYLTFQVETAEGNIKIRTYRGDRFLCQGPGVALAAYGLLQADWLPGIPGNNSLQQRVAFEVGGPRLIKGGRIGGKRIVSPCISIRRLSHSRYEVVVPGTEEQQARVQLLIEINKDEILKKKRRERLEQLNRNHAESMKRDFLYSTVGYMRRYCVEWIDAGKRITDRAMESSGFRYDDESNTRINWALNELISAFAEGEMVQSTPGLQRDGNVVYLNAKWAKLPTPA